MARKRFTQCVMMSSSTPPLFLFSSTLTCPNLASVFSPILTKPSILLPCPSSFPLSALSILAFLRAPSSRLALMPLFALTASFFPSVSRSPKCSSPSSWYPSPSSSTTKSSRSRRAFTMASYSVSSTSSYTRPSSAISTSSSLPPAEVPCFLARICALMASLFACFDDFALFDLSIVL